ncbi:DUF3293 domain-containing protein [Roseomonas elaeocarpi]|uniref:DUF3293 domain-containing protein n=1 Tax=Roseomonas elaeocarpi TaxID=907779 RepID=A0ABV6JUJ8_9PROT
MTTRRATLEPAYRRTPYRVDGPAGPVVLRIGRRDPAAAALLRALRVREAVLLTADNPASRRRAPGWNRRAARRLADATHRVPTLAGCSGTGRWQEAQRLLPLDARRGAVLARRFGQNAFVLLRHGQAPQLRWVAR